MFVPCVTVREQMDNDDNDEATNDSDDDITTGGDEDYGRKHNKSHRLVTPFEAALLASERLLRLRVNYVATSKSGKRDGVGIMLYGTKSRAVQNDSHSDRGEREGVRRAGPAEVIDLESEYLSEDSDDNSDGPAPILSSTYELVPLEPPGTEQVLRVRRCLRHKGTDQYCSQPERDLGEEFADLGGEDDSPSLEQVSICPLRSALHEVSKSFLHAKCVKRNAARSGIPADAKAVWIFTNRDDPTDGDEEERRKVTIVAEDAAENGLALHLWPLPRANLRDDKKFHNFVPFRRDVFFDHITVRDVVCDRQFDLERERRSHAEVDLEEMLEDVHEQWKKMRRALSVPLLLPGWKESPEGEDKGIMMDLYRLIQIQKKPHAVTVHQTTNKKTIKATQIIATDTGEIIPKDQSSTRIRNYAEFGGVRVPLSRDEVKEIRSQSNAAGTKASLLLLGFKPIDCIPPAHILNLSYFCYPNDDVVGGSRAAFSALHSSMLRKQVLAICEFLSRATASSRLVALVPQKEERENIEEGVTRQIQPPGFVLHHLPFEDDVRAIPEEGGEYPPADRAIVDCALNLIKHQKLCGFDVGYSFDNPALTNFWNFVESVALGEDLPERTIDETKNDSDELLKAAGEQIEAFRASLPEDDIEEKKGGTKRKAKLLVPDDSGVNWIDLFESDRLADCNIDILKKYLRSVGGRLNGRKAELVERVKNSLSERLKNGALAHDEPIQIKNEYEDI
mmetsp:Transcript_8887/g.26627  ORF Transcript_8887/g.26627 Transcript_8887/m.26627 type:complete len:734 (-) Transcript_8887:325-2526(-)